MEHRIQVNYAIKELFRKHKIFVQGNQQFDQFGGELHFEDMLRIEPYVELIGTYGQLFSLGTSSYSNFSALPIDTVIGRFTSIGHGVSAFPMAHALDRFSTSPITVFDDTVYSPSHDRFGIAPLSIGSEESKGFRPTFWAPENPPIVIGNDVWIGDGVIIKHGVHIGDGAVVGLHSIVTHDVAPYTIVAGSPAIVRKKRFPDEIIKRLEELSWWQYPYWEFDGVNGNTSIEAFIDRVEKLVLEGKISPYRPEPLTAQILLEAAD